MDPGEALIRTAYDAPDSVGWLVYADWLDEQQDFPTARDIRIAGDLRCVGGLGGGGDGGSAGAGGLGDGGDGGGGLGGGGDGGSAGAGGGLGDGGDGGGGLGDGGLGGGGDGDGGDGGGDGGGGDGGGGDGGDGGGDGGGGFPSIRSPTVESGRLYIVTIGAGYYPYVLVGWAKVDGLNVDLHGCRVIRRFGSGQSLSQLAVNGPATDTQLLPPSMVEHYWRFGFGRVIPCDPKKWAKECPKPKEL